MINFYAKKYSIVMHTVQIKIGQLEVDQFVYQQDICCYSNNYACNRCFSGGVVLWKCQILAPKSIVLFNFEFLIDNS